MIEAIREWITGIVVTIIFMSIVDLILPDSSFKKYAKIATGLIVIIAILSPVFKFFKSGINIERYIECYTESLSLDNGTNTSQVDAMVDKETIRLFKENLKGKIEGDILYQLNKTCQVTALKIDEDTSSKSFGKILYLEIKSDSSNAEGIKPVDRIIIGGEQHAAAEEGKAERDKEILQLLEDRYEVEASVVKFIK